jgi:hypothetical protein
MRCVRSRAELPERTRSTVSNMAELCKTAIRATNTRGSWRRPALLALSENNVPFDTYAGRAFDPDFDRVLFEDGTRKIDSSGGGSKGCGGLKRVTFAAQPPFNQIGHTSTNDNDRLPGT